MKFYIRKSTRAGKKFDILEQVGNDRKHVVSFGHSEYKDFTQHGDETRRRAYLARHKKNEKWGIEGVRTAGFWSRYVLWNLPTIEASLKDVRRRFGIDISITS